MGQEVNNKFINTRDSGFPEYLDFQKLRASGIEYIGELSGKIWTDHNVHDPGITTLEALIYAILDLGYRTNLPIEDILATNPKETDQDNNFFLPSQILVNNPLTIADFRKLIVDIEGVKNAWLEIEDQTPANLCLQPDKKILVDDTGEYSDVNENVHHCSNSYLNGLYHVYVELENGYDLKEMERKFPGAEFKPERDEVFRKQTEVIDKIKRALMSHRNLCEDFVDVRILCKDESGICCDIELEPGFEPEEVYRSIVDALKTFYAPAPKFYTLQQLLAKNRSIEEIYAGRPYDIKESHGFIDTVEFEALKLKRQLHLSDLYNIVSSVSGVLKVRNLKFRKCQGDIVVKNNAINWKYEIPKGHIPYFSTKCSEFHFSKSGNPVKINFEKFETLFDLNLTYSGKSLYKHSSPYLNPEVVKGIYHEDLSDYYSIQNEFPAVYGLKQGELPDDAPDSRKAKVKQFRAYLLFFDQLLANYLTQLKNIRKLFSFKSDINNKHSYFINELNDVPELQELLRFSVNQNSDESIGTQGAILAYPVSRAQLESAIKNDKVHLIDLNGKCKEDVHLPKYDFCYAKERDQAVNQLREDFINGTVEPIIACYREECYFFYFYSSSGDFAMISRKYYKSKRDALNDASSVKYVGFFAENYRSFLVAGTPVFRISFHLTLN